MASISSYSSLSACPFLSFFLSSFHSFLLLLLLLILKKLIFAYSFMFLFLLSFYFIGKKREKKKYFSPFGGERLPDIGAGKTTPSEKPQLYYYFFFFRQVHSHITITIFYHYEEEEKKNCIFRDLRCVVGMVTARWRLRPLFQFFVGFFCCF